MYKHSKLLQRNNRTRISVLRQRLKKKNYVIDAREIASKVINIELALLKVS